MTEHKREISDDTGSSDYGFATTGRLIAVDGQTRLSTTIRILTSSLSDANASLPEYQELAEAMRRAQKQQYTPAQVAAFLAEHPQFAELAPNLPDNKIDYYQFVSIVVSILSIIIALMSYMQDKQQEPTITPQQVEEIVRRVVEQTQPDATVSPSEPASSTPSTPASIPPQGRPRHQTG
ncbi:hypothetical protein ACQP2X_44320 [Actinoplanes sp. CA-131856]